MKTVVGGGGGGYSGSKVSSGLGALVAEHLASSAPFCDMYTTDKAWVREGGKQ